MKLDCSLLYILDLPTGPDPIGLVRAAVGGGATAVQLRGKRAGAAELYELALALRAELAPSGVPLIVNDRLDVALAARADGVHVGAEDLPFARVRELAPELILGVSCYGDLDRTREAALAGADYLAFGAFYPSSSKPEAGLAPPSVLGDARGLGKPVIAIGGITLQNAGEVVRAGADGIAVISAIQNADHPEQAARMLREIVDGLRRKGAAGG